MQSRGRLAALTALALLAVLLSASPSPAQDAKSFYAGKTLKIIVGLPPGGGADAYARLVQRHFGRHIPGAPSIVAQNMPGAGTLRSVMALNTGPDDGTVVAHFSSALLTEAITAPDRVKLDFRRFAWIGNVSEDVRVCYMRSASGVRHWQDMLARREVVFGATAPGTAGNVDTAMLRNLFGVKLKQVQGYAGSADKRLAVERGDGGNREQIEQRIGDHGGTWEGSGKTSRFDSDQSAAAPRTPVSCRRGRCAPTRLANAPRPLTMAREERAMSPPSSRHGVRPLLES